MWDMRLGRVGALVVVCLRLEFDADSAWGTLYFKLPSVEICHLYYFVCTVVRFAVAIVEVEPVLQFIWLGCPLRGRACVHRPTDWGG